MSGYEFTVSLHMRHPTIDPRQVSEALLIQPQHAWRAGEPRRDAYGAALDGSYRESYWTGRLMEKPQLSSQEHSVESVLTQVPAHLRRAQGFLEEFHLQGGVAEIYVSLFMRANIRLEWSPELIAGFARNHTAIGLDVHLHGGDTAGAWHS